MVAEESFGLVFLEDLEAIYAQVLYFKGFEGPPDGKEPILLTVFFRNRSCGEPLKEGYYCSYMYIVTNAFHVTLTCIQCLVLLY